MQVYCQIDWFHLHLFSYWLNYNNLCCFVPYWNVMQKVWNYDSRNILNIWKPLQYPELNVKLVQLTATINPCMQGSCILHKFKVFVLHIIMFFIFFTFLPWTRTGLENSLKRGRKRQFSVREKASSESLKYNINRAQASSWELNIIN